MDGRNSNRIKVHKRGVIWVVCILLTGAGCRTIVPVSNTTIDSVYIYHEKTDTVVLFEPDQAAMRLLIECDSTGEVLLRALQQEQGKRLSLQAQLERSEKGTVVAIDCKQDSLQKVIDRLREIIKESSSETTTETIEVEVIPKFHKACAWIVCIEILAFILRVVLKFIR